MKNIGLPGKEFVEETHEFLRRALVREACEAAYVREQNAVKIQNICRL